MAPIIAVLSCEDIFASVIALAVHKTNLDDVLMFSIQEQHKEFRLPKLYTEYVLMFSTQGLHSLVYKSWTQYVLWFSTQELHKEFSKQKLYTIQYVLMFFYTRATQRV